jgi:hypothetical protein
MALVDKARDLIPAGSPLRGGAVEPDDDQALVAVPCPEQDLIAQLPVSASHRSAVVLVQGALVVKVEELCEDFGGLPEVTDEPSRAAVHHLGVQANKLRSLVEAQRQNAKAPFLDAGRALDAAARRVLDPLEAIVAEAREQETTYLLERDRQLKVAADARARLEQEVLRAAAAAAAAQANVPAAPALPVLVPTVQQDETAARLTSIPEVVVVDESQVPSEYWVLDMTNVRRDALLLHAQGKTFPGVEVRQRKQVRMV